MSVSAKEVKALRERTGAGIMDCKGALIETGGDLEAAVDLLRMKGAAKAAKRAGRAANEGTVGQYIHHGGRIGVLVELNCETDFVAKTDEFLQLARDVAMHIAAARPLALSPEELPPELVEKERRIYLEQVRSEGKPEAIHERIIEGKLRKFYEESTLLRQKFVKDPDRSIGDLVTAIAAKTGENVRIARFARFEVGVMG